MEPLVHRSIVKKFPLVAVSCICAVCVVSLPVLAQQAARAAAGVAHTSAVPVHGTPISPAPIVHASIIHTPMSSARTTIESTAGGAASTVRFRSPRRPIRRFPSVWAVYEFPSPLEPFWGWNSCWSATCDLFWSWTLDYATVSPGPANYVLQASETPVYVYGEERLDLPQLFLKDGTILNVTDYWLVDNQLHFTMIEEYDGKATEHVIPFDALDLQTTVDVNTRRGFRFMLRNEPFEQYLRDHPEGPPPVIAPPHQ
jgi:hypothetical protein